jgi:hypothetical protein
MSRTLNPTAQQGEGRNPSQSPFPAVQKEDKEVGMPY